MAKHRHFLGTLKIDFCWISSTVKSSVPPKKAFQAGMPVLNLSLPAGRWHGKKVIGGCSKNKM